MFKAISRENYNYLLQRFPLNEQGHSRGFSPLPNYTFYAVVDESGVGLRGVAKVQGMGIFLYSRSFFEKTQDYVDTNFCLTKEHEKLQAALMPCPFNLTILMNEVSTTIQIEDEILLVCQREWNLNSGDPDYLKSFLVENNFSENELMDILTKISSCSFTNTIFSYTPGVGLVFPAEAKRMPAVNV